MAEKFRWMRRPLWLSAIIVCSVLVWCLYLAFCWISSLPHLAQALLGIAVGITSMASYSIIQSQRSHHRRCTSVYLAQLSMADPRSLQRLLPNYDKVLSWLPDPSDAELVRWINVGLEKAWPVFKEAATGLIKVQLQAVLNKYRSGAIGEVLVGKVNLGNICPYVQGVKASPVDKDDKICVEVQLDWRQNEDQEILLHVLTSGPEYIVQVKHFVIYCVMRLTFTPLSEELPCFGALVISIIEPPLVDFQTRFVSGDGKKMPEMQKAVDSTLVAALMDLLVWPGRVVVPVLPGDYSNLEASCVGHLHVQLLEATDLANKDIVGRSDPYVVLYVRRREELIKESSQMHDTSEPVWNEQFLFNVEDLSVQKLTIKVMNLDDANLNVFVGVAELAINQLEANTQEDLWIDLAGDPARLRGKCAGKVHLLIEYKPLDLSSAESDSFSNAPAESLASIPPLTQLAGNMHERIHAGVNNASEGLRAVLEGHLITNENNALRPITFMDVVSPSSKDSPVLHGVQTAQNLTSDMQVKQCNSADGDDQEDKTETACHFDDDGTTPISEDRGLVTESTLPSECKSREKRVNGFGTVESEQGIITESHKQIRQTARNFPEESSISKRPGVRVEENETDSQVDTRNKGMTGGHIVVGDPAWGLNGLPVEHCSSSLVPEDMFSTEIFEVD